MLLHAQFGVYFTSGNVSCSGECDGAATAFGINGTPPYTYLWSTGSTDAAILDLCAGTYTVTLTDANQNTVVGSVSIFQPNPLSVAIATENQLCSLAPDGSALALPTGGSSPYTYLWSNDSTSQKITDLVEGTYTVTVTDVNGCTAVNSDSIAFWDEGIWLMVNPTPTCFGANNGSAYANPMTGTAPYTYMWNTGETTDTIYNLSPGIYAVTVVDANGCSNTADSIVLEYPQLFIDATANSQATCIVGGQATAVASGGVPAYNGYNYLWDGSISGASVSDLAAGWHYVVVTDSVGCMATDSVLIEKAPDPTVTITVEQAVTCANKGSVKATPAGGTPPYKPLMWSNGQTGMTATGLDAGTYTVTVTDNLGCTATATVTLAKPEHPVAAIDSTSIVHITCKNKYGSATVTVMGGTPGYTYLWSPSGETTATADSLNQGTNTVIVTDAGGCSDTATVTINPPNLPQITIDSTTAATCTTGGSAFAIASGGTPPYDPFDWDNGETGPVAINLSAGMHTVTVTDAAGCTATTTVTIAGPPVPTVDIITVDPGDCITPGSATALGMGGTMPYPSPAYVWDNGETGPMAINLSPGLHTVTFTDANSCTATDTVTIGSPSGGIKVGDYVWYDNDKDGFQHPLETNGVDSVQVMLISAGPDGKFNTSDDVVEASTTTDNTGHYQFECVPPGTYIVMFGTIPAGYEFTKKDAVNNDCKDSDANKQGKTSPFTIQANQGDNLCVDAGIHPVCPCCLNYAGVICCNQSICEGETPDLLYETVPPAGCSGPLQYLWMQYIQIGSAPPTWVAIPGATDPDYQPGPLFETAYFMRCVRKDTCCPFIESNIITITVLPPGPPNCPSFYMNFTVKAMSSSTVELAWSTFPELGRYLYTAERSTDQQTWTAVAEMRGHEDATAPNAYKTMDHTPSNGMNYYRIKRRSASGAESVSEIRQIEMLMNQYESMAVYPNPVSQMLYIRNLIAYDADARVDIFTTDGQLLYSMTVPAGTLQSFEVPMADLPQGLYITRIRFGDGELKTMKIAKM